MNRDLNKDGKVTMTEEILAALGTYARAFLSAAIALYMTGNTNPKDLRTYWLKGDVYFG